jgi:hypothetical protein
MKRAGIYKRAMFFWNILPDEFPGKNYPGFNDQPGATGP